MIRHTITPRKDWEQKVEAIGFKYHSADNTYWDESAYYSFTMKQVDELESATNELHDMCLEAVQYVIDNDLFHLLKIPERFKNVIIDSWENDVPALYGRFDFSYDGVNPPKMLEYNADTPTSLFECGYVQWHWANEVFEDNDQFNSVHERLVDYLSVIHEHMQGDMLHVATIEENLEDITTASYILDCAMQAGIHVKWVYIPDIGFDEVDRCFVDNDDMQITDIFKLYPWEWMVNEEFSSQIIETNGAINWIEPAWKMILSNKGILPILWRMYPDHKNLLPSFFELWDAPSDFVDYVRKPLLSREGANIEIKEHGHGFSILTDGEYGEEGFIYQQLCKLPSFSGGYPVIGSWVIGGESAGVGIRESDGLITDNMSRFVPHIIR
jgi:glutathionylspermidine synthase